MRMPLEERIRELEAVLLTIAEISEYGVKQGYGAQYECSSEVLKIIYGVLGNDFQITRTKDC